MTNNIGLFDYLRQAGSVKLHERKSVSPEMYDQLKSAQKMIKRYIKGTDLKVDIYDSTTVPEEKFVYWRGPKSVYVEVTDLLKGDVKADEFWENDKSGEHILRRIFRFIDKANGVQKEPIDEFVSKSRTKYNWFSSRVMRQRKTQQSQMNVDQIEHLNEVNQNTLKLK